MLTTLIGLGVLLSDKPTSVQFGPFPSFTAWTVTNYVTGTPPVSNGSTLDSSGNPGSCLFGNIVFTVGRKYTARGFTTFVDSSNTWNPSGSFSSLVATWDFEDDPLLPYLPIGLVAYQNGNYYLLEGGSGSSSLISGNWYSFSGSSTSANDWNYIDTNSTPVSLARNPSMHPNFSSGAATVTFGCAIYAEHGSTGTIRSGQSRLDNLTMTVNY